MSKEFICQEDKILLVEERKKWQEFIQQRESLQQEIARLRNELNLTQEFKWSEMDPEYTGVKDDIDQYMRSHTNTANIPAQIQFYRDIELYLNRLNTLQQLS